VNEEALAHWGAAAPKTNTKNIFIRAQLHVSTFMKPSSGCILKGFNIQNGFMKAKTRSCMFFYIYILCNKVVLDYKFIYISVNLLKPSDYCTHHQV
jgi:hypothetical protein